MFFTNISVLGWLAPLLLLPVFIHLLNKKFPRMFRFSSIEQIKKSMARRSKLFRWRHIIMALIRTAALLLLVLAFLKPIREMFGSNQALRGPRHVLILFDHSLSMEYLDGSLSGRERGIVEAEKIINTLNPQDTLNVLCVERKITQCFQEFSGDHAEAVRFLKTLDPGLGSADFNKANGTAAQAFSGVSGRQEVYYISDFQRTTWGDVDVAASPLSARLFFVNVAPDARPNHAILGAQLEHTPISGEEAVPLHVTIGNYAPGPFSGDIEVIVDGRRSFKASASAGAWAVSKVTVPVSLGGPGIRTLEVRLPDDNLSQDDHYFLTATVAQKEEVIIVSDEMGGKKQSSGFFLDKALNPFENSGGSLAPRLLNTQILSPEQTSTSKKMFLSSLNPLGDATCKTLVNFLSKDGSMVYFCDGAADGQNLERLDATAGGSLAPIKLGDKQGVTNIESGARQILRGDFRSKYLRLFRGSQRQNLALLEFYEYYHAVPTGNGKVLLSYADGSPAMAVGHTGLGTLLVCNFSVNELASNMARQRIFPAWIQDLVKVLDSDEAPDKPFETGDDASVEVWESEVHGNAITAPDGRQVRIKGEVDGNRYRISFTAEQQGIYRLKDQAGDAYAVNVPADESDLRPADLDMLTRRSAENSRVQFVEGQHDFDALNSGRPLFHFFVFAALLFLAAELGAELLFKRLAS